MRILDQKPERRANHIWGDWGNWGEVLSSSTDFAAKLGNGDCEQPHSPHSPHPPQRKQDRNQPRSSKDGVKGLTTKMAETQGEI